MPRTRIESLPSLQDDETILTQILYNCVLKEGVKKELDTTPINKKVFKDFLGKVIFDSDREYHGLGYPILWGSDVFEFITGDRKWFCTQLKKWLSHYTEDDPEVILEVSRITKVIEQRILESIENGRLGRKMHMRDLFDLTDHLKHALSRIKDKDIRKVIMNFSLRNIECAVEMKGELPVNKEVKKFIRKIKESEE